MLARADVPKIPSTYIIFKRNENKIQTPLNYSRNISIEEEKKNR